jgi:hypothetical protein
MGFRVKIQEINTETVTKGKNRWEKAAVNYLYQGQARTQTLMSFSNPDVFKTVKALKVGDEIEIETTKDANGYNQWSRVVLAADEAPASAKTAPAGKVLGSNYETPVERKMRQLYIIRQSSIANAIEYLSKSPGWVDIKWSSADVLHVAQEFVDFVYGQEDMAPPNPNLAEVPGE